MALTLTHTTKTYPQGPYREIAEAILGASYDLSLAFVGTTRAASINRTTRGASYSPNVLSFPLSEIAGEVIIRLPIASREAASFGHTPYEHAHYLFIHGCLHLAGYEHGEQMEEAEEKFMNAYHSR